MLKGILKVVGEKVEGVADKKAGECMAFVYQPKVPKILNKKTK